MSRKLPVAIVVLILSFTLLISKECRLDGGWAKSIRRVVVILLLVLGACAPAYGQQGFVLQDDRNEPCRRFKMLVLIPVDRAKPDLSERKLSDSIDLKMVWNPCRINNSSLAVKPVPKTDKGNNYCLVDLNSFEQKLKSLLGSPPEPAKQNLIKVRP